MSSNKKNLSRFFSNLDRNIFVLSNLPEVIKGSLFSRYSRSTKGLRELLEDEFINKSQVSKTISASAGKDELDVTKAEDFYARILDGYGDDSVGELGGAHLAIEGLSMIAAKEIQDSRIGASYLEKSTRYVSFFADDGRQLYYIPTSLSPSLKKEYCAYHDHLFHEYHSLNNAVREHLKKTTKKDPKISTKAHLISINAAAFDAVRGILPASTLTNMGIYGNGRYFDQLLGKLHNSAYPELCDLAQSARKDLNQAIPGFIKRSAPSHRNYQAQANYQNQVMHGINHWINANMPVNAASKASREAVSLVEYDPQAELKILAALLYPYRNQGYAELALQVKELSLEQRQQLLLEIAELRGNRRHKLPRAFEMAYYTFDIVADYGIYRDLQRHRLLTQDYQSLTPSLGYYTPPEIEKADLLEQYQKLMQTVAPMYQKMIAEQHLKEASYVIPMAYQIRWQMTVNLRSLCWLIELRSQEQGHPRYRHIAQLMFSGVKKVHPQLATLIKFVNRNRPKLGRLDAESARRKKQQPLLLPADNQ